jgi:hypothetical protein
MGRHSVMLSPDSVRRVMPPTTMTARTRAEESKSQFPTAGGEITGSCSCCWADTASAGSSSAPLDEKKRGSSADDLGRVAVVAIGSRLENAAMEYGRVRKGVRVRICARVEKNALEVIGLRIGWCRSLR